MSDLATARRFLRLVKPIPSEIVELRTEYSVGGRKRRFSGFYNDHEQLVRDAVEFGFTCYMTVNRIREDMPVTNRLEPARTGGCAKATDIDRRDTVFMDFDPERESGTPSTDEQHNAAIELARFVRSQLPFGHKLLLGDSGNGAALYGKTDLPPDSTLPKRVLKRIQTEWETSAVKVDGTVASCARLLRLLGTDNCKGGKIGRQSTILDAPQVPLLSPVRNANGEVIREEPVDGVRADGALELITEAELEAFATPENKETERKTEERRVQQYVTSLTFGKTRAERVANFHTLLKAKGIDYKHKVEPDSLGNSCDWFHFYCVLRPGHKDAMNWIKVDDTGVSGGCHHRKCKERGGNLLIEILHVIAPELAAQAAEAYDDSYRLSRSFLQSRDPLVIWQGSPYNYRDGVYAEDCEASVKADLNRHTKQEFDRLGFKETPNVTAGLISNVWGALCAQTYDRAENVPHWRFRNGKHEASEYLAFQNGLLDVPTYLSGGSDYWQPLTPDLFALAKLPYPFDPSAPEPKRFMDYCRSQWSDGNVHLLIQEIAGDILLPDQRIHTLYSLFGKPRAGKSTFVETLENLVGLHNCCAVDLLRFASDFGLEGALGKKLIVVSEAGGIRYPPGVIEKIKRISGNDPVQITRKFKPSLSVRLNGKIVIVSNHFLEFVDQSGALFDRLVPLPFLRRVTDFAEKEDKLFFTEKIKPELPGIVLLALQGWKRLHDNGGRFTMPQICKDALSDLREAGASVLGFIQEDCERDSESFTTNTDLWEAWEGYCKRNDNKPGEKDEFLKALKSAEPGLKRDRQGKDRSRGYRGIQIKAVENP